MFSFGSNRMQVTYGALIDIGSGSVGVGIVESKNDAAHPTVVYAHREYMRVHTKEIDRTEKIRQMRETLFSAALALSTAGLQTLAAHNGKAKISRILVTCASPWAHTVSRNVSYESETEIEITPELITELETAAEEKMEDELQESSLVGKLGLHIVERATVRVSINGYTVDEPRGLKGKTVELSHMIGLVPTEIIEMVHEVQDKILTKTTLSAHTFMLVNYCIVRDMLENTEALTIVDITGESTEIGIVENGVLHRSHHVPYGSSTLLRDVAKASNTGTEHALTLLRGYAEKTLDESDRTLVEQHITPYTDALTDALATLQKTESVPGTVTITALPQLKTFFTNVIPPTLHTVCNIQCSVLDTGTESLREMGLSNESDIFIVLASRFFHKLHGCGEIEPR